MPNLVPPRTFTDYVAERGYTTSPVVNGQGAVADGQDLRVVGYDLIGPRGNRGFVPKDGDLIDLDAAALWCDGVDYATRKVQERRERRELRAQRIAAPSEIDFEGECEGLDFTDPEDRAIFRQRVAHSLRQCSLAGLRDYCKARGLPSPTSTAAACRLLADHEIMRQSECDSPRP